VKKPAGLIAIGLLFLGIGAFLYFTGGPPRADTALVERCRGEMTRRGAEAVDVARCDDTAFATAITATNADDAARAISGANRQEVTGHALAMGMIGFGLVLALSGLFLHRRLRR